METNLRLSNVLRVFATIAAMVAGSSQRPAGAEITGPTRERILLNADWRFHKGDPAGVDSKNLLYDVRPVARPLGERVAEFTEAADTLGPATHPILKAYILPTGNRFIKDPARRFVRPAGNPGGDLPFVKSDFDDSAWKRVALPHDWAIEGPFTSTGGGGMGRLPSPGVAWYRRKLDIPATDAGKSIFLDVEGAMSYATVWLNGKLVGGWPYGYASWRIDLTPYVVPSGSNQLAIRMDNPPEFSRWYPGAGIYRNVWLVKTRPVHVGQWGTFLTTPQVSRSSATINLKVTVENDSRTDAKITVSTAVFGLDAGGRIAGASVAAIKPSGAVVIAGSQAAPAKPNSPFAAAVDVITLNYQGEGIRDSPAFANFQGIRTPPQYPAFREKFPGKAILSSESAAAYSSRGTYLFPVEAGISAPVRDGSGGDSKNRYVSAYELYTADFGSSADKVFGSIDRNPYVAGEFVWSGWDYLGEPTPYSASRSSYFGIIDLAGFKKDRFYLYQAHWRSDLPMAHILPHWTWPDRVGQVTPVHVFTSAVEAELFLNGKSLGRKQRGEYEYRMRWDDVVYQPGELKVVVYKNGKEWATDTVRTAAAPAKLALSADRSALRADGTDLSFITVHVVDAAGITAPGANDDIKFTIDGPGEIAATDNGDPTSFERFPAPERNAFNGQALVVVRTLAGRPGTIRVSAQSGALQGASVTLHSHP